MVWRVLPTRRRSSVLPGAEAWSAPGDGGAGVLLVHGYPGSPASLRPLAETLAEHGLAVELPRLPGHGTTWRDLAATRWPDWARAVEEADARLAARTRGHTVLGLSNGGALALHLVASKTRRGEPPPAGLILVNPSVKVFHPLVGALPMLRRVLPVWPASGINDVAKPGVDERAYRWWPLETSASVLDLYETVRAELGDVTVPTLVFTSRQDHAVAPVNSRIVLDGIASTETEQVWLERSYHVATLDFDRDLIVERVLEFLAKVTAA